jgi:hypothetical protein
MIRKVSSARTNTKAGTGRFSLGFSHWFHDNQFDNLRMGSVTGRISEIFPTYTDQSWSTIDQTVTLGKPESRVKVAVTTLFHQKVILPDVQSRTGTGTSGYIDYHILHPPQTASTKYQSTGFNAQPTAALSQEG